MQNNKTNKSPFYKAIKLVWNVCHSLSQFFLGESFWPFLAKPSPTAKASPPPVIIVPPFPHKQQTSEVPASPLNQPQSLEKKYVLEFLPKYPEPSPPLTLTPKEVAMWSRAKRL